MMFEASIRSEPASDIEVIRRVVTAAFASAVDSNEKVSLLVDQLCDHGALTVSLVAENKTLDDARLAWLRDTGAQACYDARERDFYGRFGFTARDDICCAKVLKQIFLTRSSAGESTCGKIQYYTALELCA